MSEATEKRVLAEVDRRFGEAVESLRALVRQPSTLGNERGAQELVLNRLRQMGLDAQMWDLDPQALRNYPGFGRLDISYVSRPNVTAVWPAAAPGGRSVILNGHIDVVSPEPVSQWEHDPWGAQVEGDWMYGRGAGDMKAGVAAMLLAVQAVKATGVGLRGDVILETPIGSSSIGFIQQQATLVIGWVGPALFSILFAAFAWATGVFQWLWSLATWLFSGAWRGGEEV